MLDFDDIATWINQVDAVLGAFVPPSLITHMRAKTWEYQEEARDALFAHVSRREMARALDQYLRASEIAAYHGTRLVDEDVQSISSNGLIPLRSVDRKRRLTNVLARHSNWSAIRLSVDDALRQFGQGEEMGRREGQVHLTLSARGLTGSFNHYLNYGSEFDMHVASYLGGDEALGLLAQYGKPYLVRCRLPGEVALTAANRFQTDPEAVLNITREFLETWIYARMISGFNDKTYFEDCGMIFYDVVPPKYLESVREWTDG